MFLHIIQITRDPIDILDTVINLYVRIVLFITPDKPNGFFKELY